MANQDENGASGASTRAEGEPAVDIVHAGDLSRETKLALLRLLNAAFVAHGALFPGPRADEPHFDEQIAGHDLIVLRPAPGEAPVAMALIYPDKDGLYFGMAAVAPPLQGRGFGRRLLASAEDEARRRGLGRVWLICVPELGNAGYYARRGYRMVAEERMAAGTWGAHGPFTLATMEKRVSPRTSPLRVRSPI